MAYNPVNSYTHCLLAEWDLDRDFVLDFDRLALLLLLLLLLSFLILEGGETGKNRQFSYLDRL